VLTKSNARYLVMFTMDKAGAKGFVASLVIQVY